MENRDSERGATISRALNFLYKSSQLRADGTSVKCEKSMLKKARISGKAFSWGNIFLAVWLSLFANPARLAGQSATNNPSDSGTGAPAWRKLLADHGITFGVQWDADWFANVRGGLRQDGAVSGLLQFNVDVALKTLLNVDWLDETTFHVSSYYPYGTDISKYVGDIGGINDYAGYNSVRLYELWLQRGQQMGPVHLSLRVGSMGIDQEFEINNTVTNIFFNSSFGAPLAITGNFPVAVFPFTALGARLELSAGKSEDMKVSWRSAVFDGNSGPPKFEPSSIGAPSLSSFNKHGVDFPLNPGKGLFIISEVSFDLLKRELTDSTPPRGGGRFFIGPAHVIFGGFYATNEFEDQYEARLNELGVPNAPRTPRRVGPNYGGYVLYEQKIYEDAPRSGCGLTLFARGTFSPDDRNAVPISAETGAVYRGIFRRESATRDSFGIGFVYNRIGDSTRRADRATLAAGPGLNLDFESVLEATYQIPVTPNLQLQPDLQFVLHPGGSVQNENALVLGFSVILIY